MDDAQVLFAWVNDPDLRRASLTTEPISWEDHLAWLGPKLAGEHSLFLMGMEGDVPIGTTRFDMTGSTATISISVAKEFRGHGYGKRLLESSTSLALGIWSLDRLQAYVKVDNQASISLFEGFGFVKESEANGVVLFGKVVKDVGVSA